MPYGWLMLVGIALVLILVLALPPLTAAACVLRLLQKYLHHAALAKLWFLSCLARPPLAAVAHVP